MNKKIEWLDGNVIKVESPKKPKKITGTRLASIMDHNKWTTPFKTWCEITKTYEEPFEDTIYTIFGKTVEPKQAEYVQNTYFPTEKIVSPKDVFGDDYFNKTYGDFFKDKSDIFGGMWDYLLQDEDGKVVGVLEMKTTKRAEDWQDETPIYYELQASLYAYLLGVDKVYMVCSFTDNEDYNNPDGFIPSAKNTIIREFNVSDKFDMPKITEWATNWWNEHVICGVSPEYDEKKDADILKALRTVSFNPTSDIDSIIARAEELKETIDKKKAEMKDISDEYDNLLEQIKDAEKEQIGNNDRVVLTGGKYEFKLSKITTETVDKKALKKDGLAEKYITAKESFRLTVNEIKE